MTAATFAGNHVEPDHERRVLLAPAEGWSTVVLVVLMCMTLGWSIADARWVLGRQGLSDFLPTVMVLAAGWGMLSAKAGWPRWLAHLLGAVTACLVVPIIVGSVLENGAGGVGVWYRATAGSVVGAVLDLTYRHLPFTTETGHFMLVLGLICWATGQFAGYVLFHHHRPLNAVIVVGAGLVLNMSLTARDQLMLLVLYSLAALFLLIRFHAFDEHMLWIRHRIGDATSLSGLYLRGGTVFVGAAIVSALFLTSTANSAPLGSMWIGTDRWIVDIGRQLERVFRSGGTTRLTSIGFGPNQAIGQVWTTDTTPVLRIQVPDTGRYYWRAVTYDHFDGYSWGWTNPTDRQVAANATVLAGSADNSEGLLARRTATFSFTELPAFPPGTVFAPDTPLAVNIKTQLTTIGGLDAFFGGLTSSAADYVVASDVPLDYDKASGDGLTANKLRVAGTDYPPGIKNLYATRPDPATIGPNTQALLEEILAAHPGAKNPYDIADAIRTYLRSEGNFRYNPDISNVACGNTSVVECFASARKGFCLHYASTMAILLRMEGIPSRLAMGFLPGARQGKVETVPHSAAHAWVEAYFPRYGWVQFDPTSTVGQGVELPAGPVVTAPPSSPRASLNPDDNGEQRRSILPTSPAGAAVGSTQGGPGSGPFIAIGVLLAIAVVGLAYAAWLRGPRTAPEPDSVYAGLVRLARRFGFAPMPSQTVYEYTAALSDVLPKARPDLEVVANAKVEVAYGRRILGEDRLYALREAQRRVRVALLGLLFRRRPRGPRRTTRR